MHIDLGDSGLPENIRGEILDVLARIPVGSGPRCWPERPDVVRVLRSFSGGRSACQVLEVVFKTGPREAFNVLKLGPAYELEREFRAFCLASSTTLSLGRVSRSSWTSRVSRAVSCVTPCPRI